MKLLYGILIILLLTGCGKNYSKQVNPSTSTSKDSAVSSSSLGSQNYSTGINLTTGSTSSLKVNTNQNDIDLAKLFFNTSGNISNLIINGDKIYFYDNKEGEIKYYYNNQYYSTNISKDTEGFDSFVISKDGKQILWNTIEYYDKNGKIISNENYCSSDSGFSKTLTNIFTINIDGTKKKLLKKFIIPLNVGLQYYYNIAGINGNDLLINKSFRSCGGAYEPCYNEQLQIYNIKKILINY